MSDSAPAAEQPPIKLSFFAATVTLPKLAEHHAVAYAYVLHALDAGHDLGHPLTPSNLPHITISAINYAAELEEKGEGISGPLAIAELQARVMARAGYGGGEGSENGFETAVQSLVEEDGRNPPAPSQS